MLYEVYPGAVFMKSIVFEIMQSGGVGGNTYKNK